jgi:16S rRNA U516 pseudouridylate synthase RsuA-like enzyme
MDFNSEGLCLLTPNSVLAQKLAASKLPRYYRVRIHGLITDAKLEGLRAGIYVGGRKQAPIQVKVERSGKTGAFSFIQSISSSIQFSFLARPDGENTSLVDSPKNKCK